MLPAFAENTWSAWQAALQSRDTRKANNMTNETVLPDGSAFFTASFPLPKDHWIYAPRCEEWDTERDTSADTPHPILTHQSKDAVVAALKFAIRGATMNGKENDFDPDALLQNAVYALCGPYGKVVPVQSREAPKQGELRNSRDVEKDWQYWSDIVMPNGALDIEQLKLELSAFSMLIEGLPELFMHITGGMCSYETTHKSVVMSLHDDHVNNLIDEAIEEYKQDLDEQRDKEQPSEAVVTEPDPDYLCPNCLTPWKCNGPHIEEVEKITHPSADKLDAEVTLPELPNEIGMIVGRRLTPPNTDEFFGYFSEWYSSENKELIFTADQMRDYARAAIAASKEGKE